MEPFDEVSHFRPDFCQSLQNSLQLYRITLASFIVDIALYSEQRIRLLLPRVPPFPPFPRS